MTCFLSLSCTCNSVRSQDSGILTVTKWNRFPFAHLQFARNTFVLGRALPKPPRAKSCDLPSRGFIFSCGSDRAPFLRSQEAAGTGTWQPASQIAAGLLWQRKGCQSHAAGDPAVKPKREQAGAWPALEQHSGFLPKA